MGTKTDTDCHIKRLGRAGVALHLQHRVTSRVQKGAHAKRGVVQSSATDAVAQYLGHLECMQE